MKNNTMMHKLEAWHQTRLGLLVFAVLELVAAYGFASLAIDKGNLWWYVLTLVFLVGFLQNFFKLLKSMGRRVSRGRK